MASTILLDDIRIAVGKGSLVGVLFLDLSRAFDTVSHATLLSKLKAYGVKKETLEWFKSYLFHWTEQVEIDSTLSDEKPVFSGAPEGSILGPLLFVIFYNDLTDYITNAEVLQYADDTVLYFANSKVSLIEKALNDDLKRISTFCHDNELVLNLKKTKTEVMLCGTTTRISKSEELRLFYQGERILQSSCCKYLGTIVNPTATMSDDFDAKYK